VGYQYQTGVLAGNRYSLIPFSLQTIPESRPPLLVVGYAIFLDIRTRDMPQDKILPKRDTANVPLVHHADTRPQAVTLNLFATILDLVARLAIPLLALVSVRLA